MNVDELPQEIMDEFKIELQDVNEVFCTVIINKPARIVLTYARVRDYQDVYSIVNDKVQVILNKTSKGMKIIIL